MQHIYLLVERLGRLRAAAECTCQATNCAQRSAADGSYWCVADSLGWSSPGAGVKTKPSPLLPEELNVLL